MQIMDRFRSLLDMDRAVKPPVARVLHFCGEPVCFALPITESTPFRPTLRPRWHHRIGTQPWPADRLKLLGVVDHSRTAVGARTARFGGRYAERLRASRVKEARRAAREFAFQLALLAALLLGFLSLMVSVVAALERRVDAGFAGTVIVFGLSAVLAWSLSRPSAKA